MKNGLKTILINIKMKNNNIKIINATEINNILLNKEKKLLV
jgi:hypothetical protein